MPGVRSSMTHGSRADGTFCSCSCVKLLLVPVLRVSTSGASLETVTVSWSAETSRVALVVVLPPTLDRDALDDHRPEAGQLELDRVGVTGLQPRELIGAGTTGHRRLRLDERTAAHRHHHARQHRPGRIHHPTHDIAGRGLRHRWRRPEDQAQHRHDGEQSASHPFLLEVSA